MRRSVNASTYLSEVGKPGSEVDSSLHRCAAWAFASAFPAGSACPIIRTISGRAILIRRSTSSTALWTNATLSSAANAGTEPQFLDFHDSRNLGYDGSDFVADPGGSLVKQRIDRLAPQPPASDGYKPGDPHRGQDVAIFEPQRRRTQ